MKYSWLLILAILGLFGCGQGSERDAGEEQPAEIELLGPAFVLFYTEN